MLHRKPHVISSPESIFELIEILEKKEQGDAGLETLIRTHINRFTLKDLKELSQKLGEAGMQQKVAHYCQPELFLALIDAIVEDLTEGNNSGGENLRLVRLLGWVLSGVDTGIKEKILMHVSRTTPGADLQQFAGACQSDRLGMQYAADIAQTRHALTIEQMSINAGRLRRNIGAQRQCAPAQLVHQLESAQIHVITAVNQQRLFIFQQGRNNQLIAGFAQQIEKLRAHLLDAPRFIGKHVLNVFGE